MERISPLAREGMRGSYQNVFDMEDTNPRIRESRALQKQKKNVTNMLRSRKNEREEKIGSLLEWTESQNYKEIYYEAPAELDADMMEWAWDHHSKNASMRISNVIDQISSGLDKMKTLKEGFSHMLKKAKITEQLETVIDDLQSKLLTLQQEKKEQGEVLDMFRMHMKEKDDMLVHTLKREEMAIKKVQNLMRNVRHINLRREQTNAGLLALAQLKKLTFLEYKAFYDKAKSLFQEREQPLLDEKHEFHALREATLQLYKDFLFETIKIIQHDANTNADDDEELKKIIREVSGDTKDQSVVKYITKKVRSQIKQEKLKAKEEARRQALEAKKKSLMSGNLSSGPLKRSKSRLELVKIEQLKQKSKLERQQSKAILKEQMEKFEKEKQKQSDEFSTFMKKQKQMLDRERLDKKKLEKKLEKLESKPSTSAKKKKSSTPSKSPKSNKRKTPQKSNPESYKLKQLEREKDILKKKLLNQEKLLHRRTSSTKKRRRSSVFSNNSSTPGTPASPKKSKMSKSATQQPEVDATKLDEQKQKLKQIRKNQKRLEKRKREKLKAIEQEKINYDNEFTIDLPQEVGPRGKIAIVNTSVKHVDELWGENPEAMREALSLHDNLLRKSIELNQGYEINHSHGCFELVFSTVQDAINFCIETQIGLHNSDWGDILLHKYAKEITDEEDNVIQRGLRVCMGIHVGSPTMTIDPITKRSTYSGVAMVKAKRIESCATGAEICISNEIWKKICDENFDTYFSVPIYYRYRGKEKLPGSNAVESIRLIIPEILEKRSSWNELMEHKLKKDKEKKDLLKLNIPTSALTEQMAPIERMATEALRELENIAGSTEAVDMIHKMTNEIKRVLQSRIVDYDNNLSLKCSAAMLEVYEIKHVNIDVKRELASFKRQLTEQVKVLNEAVILNEIHHQKAIENAKSIEKTHEDEQTKEAMAVHLHEKKAEDTNKKKNRSIERLKIMIASLDEDITDLQRETSNLPSNAPLSRLKELQKQLVHYQTLIRDQEMHMQQMQEEETDLIDRRKHLFDREEKIHDELEEIRKLKMEMMSLSKSITNKRQNFEAEQSLWKKKQKEEMEKLRKQQMYTERAVLRNKEVHTPNPTKRFATRINKLQNPEEEAIDHPEVLKHSSNDPTKENSSINEKQITNKPQESENKVEQDTTVDLKINTKPKIGNALFRLATGSTSDDEATHHKNAFKRASDHSQDEESQSDPQDQESHGDPQDRKLITSKQHHHQHSDGEINGLEEEERIENQSNLYTKDNPINANSKSKENQYNSNTSEDQSNSDLISRDSTKQKSAQQDQDSNKSTNDDEPSENMEFPDAFDDANFVENARKYMEEAAKSHKITCDMGLQTDFPPQGVSIQTQTEAISPQKAADKNSGDKLSPILKKSKSIVDLKLEMDAANSTQKTSLSGEKILSKYEHYLNSIKSKKKVEISIQTPSTPPSGKRRSSLKSQIASLQLPTREVSTQGTSTQHDHSPSTTIDVASPPTHKSEEGEQVVNSSRSSKVSENSSRRNQENPHSGRTSENTRKSMDIIQENSKAEEENNNKDNLTKNTKVEEKSKEKSKKTGEIKKENLNSKEKSPRLYTMEFGNKKKEFKTPENKKSLAPSPTHEVSLEQYSRMQDELNTMTLKQRLLQNEIERLNNDHYHPSNEEEHDLSNTAVQTDPITITKELRSMFMGKQVAKLGRDDFKYRVDDPLSELFENMGSPPQLNVQTPQRHQTLNEKKARQRRLDFEARQKKYKSPLKQRSPLLQPMSQTFTNQEKRKIHEQRHSLQNWEHRLQKHQERVRQQEIDLKLREKSMHNLEQQIRAKMIENTDNESMNEWLRHALHQNNLMRNTQPVRKSNPPFAMRYQQKLPPMAQSLFAPSEQPSMYRRNSLHKYNVEFQQDDDDVDNNGYRVNKIVEPQPWDYKFKIDYNDGNSGGSAGFSPLLTITSAITSRQPNNQVHQGKKMRFYDLPSHVTKDDLTSMSFAQFQQLYRNHSLSRIVKKVNDGGKSLSNFFTSPFVA